MEGLSSKFMITINNPHKHLRNENDENYDMKTHPYTQQEWELFFMSIPLQLRDEIAYIKVALEEGDTGTPHLQGCIFLRSRQRKSFIYNRLKMADVKPARGTNEQVSSYPGNPDFIHTDGRPKGGKCFWVWESGDIPKGKVLSKDISATENRLLDLKEKIDRTQGRAIKALWHEDFYLMIRYSRAIKEYVSDVYEIRINEDEHQVKTAFYRLQQQQEALKEKDKEIKLLTERMQALSARLENLEIEKLETERLLTFGNFIDASNGGLTL